MKDQEIQQQINDIRVTFSTFFDKHDPTRTALAIDGLEHLFYHMPLTEVYSPETLEMIRGLFADVKISFEQRHPQHFNKETLDLLYEKQVFIEQRYQQFPFHRVSMHQMLRMRLPDIEHYNLQDPKVLKYVNELIIRHRGEVQNIENRLASEYTLEQMQQWTQAELDLLRILEEIDEAHERAREEDLAHMERFIEAVLLEQAQLNERYPLAFDEIFTARVQALQEETRSVIEQYTARQVEIQKEIQHIKPKVAEKVQRAEQLYQAAVIENKKEDKQLLEYSAAQTEKHAVGDLYNIKGLEKQLEAALQLETIAKERLALEEELLEAYEQADTAAKKEQIMKKFQEKLKENSLRMEMVKHDSQGQLHTVKMDGCQQQCRMDAFRLKQGFRHQDGGPLIAAELSIDEQAEMRKFELKARILFAMKKDKFAKRFHQFHEMGQVEALRKSLTAAEQEQFDEILREIPKDVHEVVKGMGQVPVSEMPEPSAPPLEEEQGPLFLRQGENLQPPPLPSAPPAPSWEEREPEKITHPIIGVQLVTQIVLLQGNYGIQASGELKDAVLRQMKADGIDAIIKPNTTKVFVKVPLTAAQIEKYEGFAKEKAAEISMKYKREVTEAQMLTQGFDHQKETAKGVPTPPQVPVGVQQKTSKTPSPHDHNP